LPAWFNASRQKGAEDLAALRQTDGRSFARGAEHRDTRATRIQAPARMGCEPSVVNSEVIFEWQGKRTGQTESNRELHIVSIRVK